MVRARWPLPLRHNLSFSYLLLVCSRQPEIRDFFSGRSTNYKLEIYQHCGREDWRLGGRAFHRHALHKGSVLIRYRARWRPYFPRDRFSEPVGKTTTGGVFIHGLTFRNTHGVRVRSTRMSAFVPRRKSVLPRATQFIMLFPLLHYSIDLQRKRSTERLQRAFSMKTGIGETYKM